jgi:hypothetical protein
MAGVSVAVAVCLLGACSPKSATPSPAQPGKPVAQQPPPAPPPADAETWRPSWWTESIRATAETLSASAMAEDADLNVARRKAVEAAMAKVRTALSKEPPEPTTKVDSIRLPDGRYRAFVLATARIN